MIFANENAAANRRFPGWVILLLLLQLTLGVFSTACAEQTAEATDITVRCLFDGRGGKNQFICDQKYSTVWKSSKRDGIHALTITAPEKETVGGLLIRWGDAPQAADVQARAADGGWLTVAHGGADFYAQYIAVPGLTECRVIASGDPGQPLQIADITVITPGSLPNDIQVWEKAGDKVDMMLITAHPDDEVLWFGGLIPYYAGERGKRALVVCATTKHAYRRLELLDCLWTCGNHIQPVFCDLPDYVGKSFDWLLKAWDYDALLERYTALYRQYKPDVVVLQDIKGESGHNGHRAMSKVGRACAPLAADPAMYPASVQKYGVWDIPKVYVHLYAENEIRMDWNLPLPAFGGMSAQDVARLGFAKQVSQTGNHKLKDGGLYDNALFGLYRTRVGLDVKKNDLFEHIP